MGPVYSRFQLKAAGREKDERTERACATDTSLEREVHSPPKPSLFPCLSTSHVSVRETNHIPPYLFRFHLLELSGPFCSLELLPAALPSRQHRSSELT